MGKGILYMFLDPRPLSCTVGRGALHHAKLCRAGAFLLHPLQHFFSLVLWDMWNSILWPNRSSIFVSSCPWQWLLEEVLEYPSFKMLGILVVLAGQHSLGLSRALGQVLVLGHCQKPFHKITSFRLEKASEIITSNLWLITSLSTKCHTQSFLEDFKKGMKYFKLPQYSCFCMFGGF